MSVELGVLGAGNMAEAIVAAVIRSNVLSRERILASDVSEQRREWFRSHLGVAASPDNRQVAAEADMLLLSVKPQMMGQVLDDIAPVIRPTALIVSIAAGVSSRFIETRLGNRAPWRVIRTMPNTPMLVGQGMVALSCGNHATQADADRARKLFESAAAVIEVDEKMLDAVTALSGSGPAYVFYLAERMIQAGVELGFSPEQARLLVVRTVSGAAAMLSGEESPQELRRKVTSPGGTTQAAVTCMDAGRWGETTVEAIHAAARRGRELGS